MYKLPFCEQHFLNNLTLTFPDSLFSKMAKPQINHFNSEKPQI